MRMTEASTLKSQQRCLTIAIETHEFKETLGIAVEWMDSAFLVSPWLSQWMSREP